MRLLKDRFLSTMLDPHLRQALTGIFLRYMNNVVPLLW